MFDGRAGCYQNLQTAHIQCLPEMVYYVVKNLFRFGQPSHAVGLAGHFAHSGIDEFISQIQKLLHIVLHNRICVHLGIHGRRDHNGRLRRHNHSGKKIIGYPRGYFADYIARGGGNQDQISPFSQRYMMCGIIAGFGEKL
jgi:hypothetical protein